MGEAKMFASLSPRLLARKGGAKPAMRRQVQPLNDLDCKLSAEPQDDLGWNDMGEDLEALGQSDGAPAAPRVKQAKGEVVAIHGTSAPRRAKQPQIVASQKALAARVEQRPAPKLRLGQRRAAFTLRIDSERHLQLRLASTVAGRSAQSLLTEALDRMLDDMPEIRSLAENVRNRS